MNITKDFKPFNQSVNLCKPGPLFFQFNLFILVRVLPSLKPRPDILYGLTKLLTSLKLTKWHCFVNSERQNRKLVRIIINFRLVQKEKWLLRTLLRNIGL